MRTASSRPTRASLAQSPTQKKSHSVLAAQTGTGREVGKAGIGGTLGPPDDAEKTEEQKEMERKERHLQDAAHQQLSLVKDLQESEHEDDDFHERHDDVPTPTVDMTLTFE